MVSRRCGAPLNARRRGSLPDDGASGSGSPLSRGGDPAATPAGLTPGRRRAALCAAARPRCPSGLTAPRQSGVDGGCAGRRRAPGRRDRRGGLRRGRHLGPPVTRARLWRSSQGPREGGASFSGCVRGVPVAETGILAATGIAQRRETVGETYRTSATTRSSCLAVRPALLDGAVRMMASPARGG